MKVLHVLNTNKFSGAENVVCQIISCCLTDDTQFVYCSMDGPVREALAERGIEFAPILKMSVSELKRVINEVRPDLIHAHDMRASLFVALACERIPFVSHIHNNNFDSRGLSLKSLLYYSAAKKAKHIFWVSQSSFDGYAFHKSFVKKSTVLYNIIDIDALKKKVALDTKTYDYELVFLGRLTPPKNPHRLIDVFRLVANKRPKTKMAIIGTGDLEEETKRLVIDKGLTDNVTFLGFQSNPFKMLQDARVMIMTSRWEGTPMCALESLALGVPIVSTPTDGLCELIKDDVNGYLSDDNDELARRVVALIENNKKRNELSLNSINFSIHYNDRNMYAKTVTDIYMKSIMG